MTLEEMKEQFNKFASTQQDVLFKKGNDYAKDVDRLSNFKSAGEILQLSPEMQCLSLVATKVARLGNLLSKEKNVLNESVEDSLLDLANYTFLTYCILHEKRSKIFEAVKEPMMIKS